MSRLAAFSLGNLGGKEYERGFFLPLEFSLTSPSVIEFFVDSKKNAGAEVVLTGFIDNFPFCFAACLPLWMTWCAGFV
jgi:hypothetical protein